MIFTFSLLIMSILVSYDLRFVFNYFKIKSLNCSGQAIVVGFSRVKGSFGQVPILNYESNGIKYTGIKPLHSSFVTFDSLKENNIVQIFINTNDPSKCIIPSVISVYSQIFVTVFVYFLFFYSFYI